jgi:YggT family protein
VGLVCLAITLYYFVLFARIILSWVTMFSNPSPALRPLVKVVYDLTEPIMGPMRRVIPPIGGLDISPIFIFIMLQIVAGALGC